MGAGGSKPEDIAAMARTTVAYSPPLGPPNPVSRCAWREIAPAGAGGSASRRQETAFALSTPAPAPAGCSPVQANPVVFFDIKLGRYGEGTPLGRVEIELKADVTPLTAENFLQLVRRAAEPAGHLGYGQAGRQACVH